MRIKFYKNDDFVNYRKGVLFIGMPFCTWKCCLEAGIPCSVCQNYEWSRNPILEIGAEELVAQYLQDPLEEAVVFGGLEPMDSFEDVYEFVLKFREKSADEIIIYTGYYPEEIEEKLTRLQAFSNIIVKFGRYIPNQKARYDDVLGVTLASDNQFAQKIS